MMRVNGLILAAGMSSRMKAFKPLLDLAGKPVIQRSIESLLDGGVEQVVVVLGHRGSEVEAAIRKNIDMSRISLIINPAYKEADMLASIKAGIRNLPVGDVFFLLPADMPLIRSSSIKRIIAHRTGSNSLVTFPSISGRKKHPPLISYDCINRILGFDQQGGLRVLWEELAEQTDMVEIKDLGCTLDLDTPEEYQKAIDLLK